MKIVIRSILILFLMVGFTQCKERAKSLDKDELSQLENALTEDGFFWQNGDEAFLFKKNGKVAFIKFLSYASNDSAIEKEGKWYLNKEQSTLNVALENMPQFELEILNINKNISELKFKDDKGTILNLKKMKLLDDRFRGIIDNSSMEEAIEYEEW